MSFDFNTIPTEFLKLWCERNYIEPQGTRRNLIKKITEDPEKRAKCLVDINLHHKNMLKMDIAKDKEGQMEKITIKTNDDNENRNEIIEKVVHNVDMENVTEDEKKMQNKEDDMITQKNSLELQLEILKKEKEMIELENEMKKLKMKMEPSNEAAALSQSVPFEVLKELIPVFDGNDQVEVWIVQLKNVKECYNLCDNILRALICCKFKGKAQEWLHLHSSQLMGPIDELLVNIQQMFKNKISKIGIRQKLQDRKWQSSENFASYYKEKLSLASSVGLENDEFIEYLINGIPDVHLRNTARLQNFSSPDELLQAFYNVEVFANKREKTASVTKCYNCNSKGHIANECRKPKRQDGACFACGEIGHFAKDCTFYKKKEINKNEYNVK